MSELLKQLERESRPTEEEVRRFARLIYEKEGRPEGRALQHWFEAEKQLWAFKLVDLIQKRQKEAPPAGRLGPPENLLARGIRPNLLGTRPKRKRFPPRNAPAAAEPHPKNAPIGAGTPRTVAV